MRLCNWILSFALVFCAFGSRGVAATDTTPPVLAGLAFTPSSVTVTSSWAQVVVDLHITDNQAGFQSGFVQFQSPSGLLNPGATIRLLPISGTPLDGNYQAVITIPQNAEAGTWTLTTVSLRDGANNVRLLGTTDILALGLPTTIQVSSLLSNTSLTFSSTALTFSVLNTLSGTSTQQFAIGSSGSTLSFAITSNTTWLTVSQSVGTTPATLNVTANPAGLFPGVFYGSLTVAAAGANNSPQTISVTLNIGTTAGNAPPYSVELSPFQGSGASQIFTATFNDDNGYADIARASIRFYESYAGVANACIVEYRPQVGQFYLLDDAGVSWLGPITIGFGSSLQNSACMLNGAASSSFGNGTVLTVNYALIFNPSFGTAGGREPRKAVCTYAKDTVGAGEDQSCLGLWVPEAPNALLIPRYRLYNPANYAHFFTASKNERDTLVTRGLQPEDPVPGMAYNQPTVVSAIPTQPFYRILFYPQNGAPIFHYWTHDREEYKTAVRLRTVNLGEGIDSFLLSGQVAGSYPTYRLRFTAGPTAYPIYHYALKAETDALIAMGWGVSMGIDGYLQPVPTLLDQSGATAKVHAGSAAPVIAAVLNSASHDSGAVAPGSLIQIFGQGFSKLAQVLVDDVAVPVVGMTSDYLEIEAPAPAAGKLSLSVVVDDLGRRSEPVTLNVVAANPALFVTDFFGRGNAETLTSEPGTVTVQLTGAGEPGTALSARIAGHPAEVLSTEPVAGMPGRLAVKLKLPAEALADGAESGTVAVQAGEAVTQPGVLVRLH
jgi:uncharacterized protein (TIGR03437 family)